MIVFSVTLSHIETSEVKRTQHLNHIDFNHTLTLTTLFPQSIIVVSGPLTLKPKDIKNLKKLK